MKRKENPPPSAAGFVNPILAFYMEDGGYALTVLVISYNFFITFFPFFFFFLPPFSLSLSLRIRSAPSSKAGRPLDKKNKILKPLPFFFLFPKRKLKKKKRDIKIIFVHYLGQRNVLLMLEKKKNNPICNVILHTKHDEY